MVGLARDSQHIGGRGTAMERLLNEVNFGALFAALFFAGTGMVALVAAIKSLLKDRQFRAVALQARAKIVANETYVGESEDDEGRVTRSTIHTPVVEFKDQFGDQRRVNVKSSESGVPHAVGTEVTVLYHPNYHKRVEIDSGPDWMEQYGPAGMLGAGGLASLLVAAYIWFG